jgi:N-carbamoyl-L-amino-acid hydrolase
VTVALVDWADEEGARFGRSLFGSSAVAGTLDPEAVRDLVDAGGRRLEDVVREHGVELDRAHEAGSRLEHVRAYLELHIEQGPVLEGEGLAVGTVLGTVGVERHRVVFDGQAAHAGSTPIDQRRDSFLAASRFALELREVARRHHGVCTVGDARCEPGVVTAVPGRTTLLVDQRNIDAGELAEMLAEMRSAAEDAAEAERCTVEFEHLWRIDPIPFDRELVAAATAACREVAGSDRRVPTVMIFSSSTNGLSHTKEEDTPVAHLELAARAYGSTARTTIELCAERA